MKYVLWIWFLVYAVLFYVLLFKLMLNTDKIETYIRSKTHIENDAIIRFLFVLLVVACLAALFLISNYTWKIYKFIAHWYYGVGMNIS